MKKNILFMLISLSILGLFVLIYVYYIPFMGAYTYILFWGAFICLLLPIALIINYYDISIKKSVFIVFIWGLILYLPKYLRNPFLPSSDGEIQFYNHMFDIIRHGNFDILFTGGNLANYYPGMQIITSILANILNIDPWYAGTMLIALVHSMLLVLVFLISYQVTADKKIAIIGALMYTANCNYSYLNSLYFYESLGIFELFLSILLIVYCYKNNNVSHRLLSIIVLGSLVITHHFSSYFLFIFTIIFCIIAYLYKSRFKLLTTTAIVFVLIMSWIIYSATKTIIYYRGMLKGILVFMQNAISEGKPRTFFIGSELPRWETMTDFLYIPLVILLCSIGIYLIIKSKLYNRWIFQFIVYGPLLFLISLILIPTSSAEVAYRSWACIFLGVAIIIAFALKYFMNYKHGNSLVAVIICFLVFCSLSIDNNQAGRFYNSSELASGPAIITTDAISAANWFKNEMGTEKQVIGDLGAYMIFSGYAKAKVNTFAWNVFYPTEMNSMVKENLDGEYLVVDKRISMYMPKYYNSYFDRMEQQYLKDPPYEVSKPLNKASLEKFNETNYLKEIYSGENLSIYQINKY